MHRSTRVLAVALSVAATTTASADPSPPALFDSLHLPPAVLVGSHGGRLGRGLRLPHGWFLGADTGWSWMLGSSEVAARTTTTEPTDAWCVGVRAGYQLPSGVAVQARFDKLDVGAPDGSGQLTLATAGVRYSVPIMPMPFAEAMVGPVFHGGDASFAAGLGVGATLFVMRHLAFDLSVRDWLVDIGGIHHAPTVTIGISAGFGG